MTMNKDGVKVMVKPVSDPHTRGFQSSEAMAKATASEDEADSDTEVKSGLVNDADLPPDHVSAKTERDEQTKMVRVRVRQFVMFKYGPNQYKLDANKETLVPMFIKRHLEEKGLL